VVIYLPHGNSKTTPGKEITKKQLTIKKRKENSMFGDFIKNLRIEKDIGLREFCRRLLIDASNWSKIERGVLAPPQDEEKLQKIAEILDIKIGSDMYAELKDKAAIDAGIIPKDILSDNETLNALPMFFRTVRNEKPTTAELEKLIEKIRGSS
jgi:transcriptional regulator with XRE-family HTH domain